MNFFIFITCHACVTMYWYRGLNIDHKFCCLTLKLKVDIQIRANYTNVFLFALGHLTHHLRASPWPGLCNKKRLQCTCRSSCTVSTSPPPWICSPLQGDCHQHTWYLPVAIYMYASGENYWKRGIAEEHHLVNSVTDELGLCHLEFKNSGKMRHWTQTQISLLLYYSGRASATCTCMK